MAYDPMGWDDEKNEGKEAFHNGDWNPYKRNSRESEDWEKGHKEEQEKIYGPSANRDSWDDF
jgi:hypothetical protein